MNREKIRSYVSGKNIALFLCAVLVFSSIAYSGESAESKTSQGLLILPSDGNTIPATPVFFKWNTVSDAIRYQIQVSTDPSFNERFIVIDPFLHFRQYESYDMLPGRVYYWRIRTQFSDYSWNDYCQPWYFITTAATGVEDESLDRLPEQFELGQNFPNPFNPITTVEYNLPRSAFVDLTIYDILGRKVRQLIDAEQASGAHSTIWDGTDDDGNLVAGGIYFYRLRAGDFGESKKMLLLK